jgi:hypothetical protein
MAKVKGLQQPVNGESRKSQLKNSRSHVWWYMSVIPALWRLKQEEVSLIQPGLHSKTLLQIKPNCRKVLFRFVFKAFLFALAHSSVLKTAAYTVSTDLVRWFYRDLILQTIV